jgi:GLPGLI family protein
MKNILMSLVMATIAMSVTAQNNWQGHINYIISVLGNEQLAQMMNGNSMNISVKDSMSKIEMNMSMMQTNTIVNNITDKGTMFIDMMGNKYSITPSPDDIKKQAGLAASGYDVTYIDSTKVIAGHVCKKAIVTMKNDKKLLPVWYAPDIKVKIPMLDQYMYSKVDGLSLEWEIEAGPIDMEFTCTLLDNKPVDSSIFTIPNGYTPMSYDQFKAAMTGMGGH